MAVTPVASLEQEGLNTSWKKLESLYQRRPSNIGNHNFILPFFFSLRRHGNLLNYRAREFRNALVF